MLNKICFPLFILHIFLFLKYIFILLMQNKVQTIHNTKYRMDIVYDAEENSIGLYLVSKIKNQPAKQMFSALPNELMKEDIEKMYRKASSHRRMRIQVPPNKEQNQQGNGQNHRVLLEQISSVNKYNGKIAQKYDKATNRGIKYWKEVTRVGEVNVVLDPHNKQLHIGILNKAGGIKVGQATILPTHCIGQQSPPDLLSAFRSIINSQVWFIDWSHRMLITDAPSLEVPLRNSVTLPNLPNEELSPKETVFRHIFLTELIIHMIINHFGRDKGKNIKEKEGYEQVEYTDQDLESLRSWGHRWNEFRDIPVKKQKKGKDDEESLEEEEEEEQEKKGENKGENKKGKKEKPTTKLGKMGLKIQERKEENLCNFTFISGEEKSKINKMRYCLHQMTRETDQTQAMMDFIRLVFHAVPIEKLVGNYVDNNEDEKEKKSTKDESMRSFLKWFRVKKDVKTCLTKYTSENWFYKIINIGLRVLHEPYQLVYLRLPFSHLFWSIKLLYQQHKRTIFHKKKEKNKCRTIKLYRGCQLSLKQIEALKDSVNGYVEAEGFLSTSLDPKAALGFVVNVGMEIEVPIANLKSLFDNGFVHLTNYSAHPDQKEVLINAFNVFKVQGVRDPKQGIDYRVYLEYGSIKSVEENVLKKSDHLIDEEFKWKMDQQQISQARRKLEQNEEYMTKKEHKKLMALLPKEEEKVKDRKKKLDEWRAREYQSAVGKLSKWEKELLINTKHQQQQMCGIENYGDLLCSVGQYRRACVYFRRKVKHLQLDRAVEALQWRKSECIILKQLGYRNKLLHCFSNIGRIGESWIQMEKLLNVFVSINLPQQNEYYYNLLYNMYANCQMHFKQEEAKKYRDRFIQILEKNQLQVTQAYKQQMKEEIMKKEMEKIAEQEAEKEKMKKEKMKKEEKKKIKQKHKQRKAERKQQLKQMKQALQHIRLSTYGLYSNKYLSALQDIIHMLRIWKSWKPLLKQAHRYMQIRNYAPHVESRMGTYNVLMCMMDACLQGKKKKEMRRVCVRIAQYTHTSIHNLHEYRLVMGCLHYCFRLQCWKAGKMPLIKFTQASIKCKLSQDQVVEIMLLGYALLVLSVSEFSVVDYFLKWIKTLYQQQQLTQTYGYLNIRSHIEKYNNYYKNYKENIEKENSNKTRAWDERDKDWHDANVIKHVWQSLGDGKEWNERPWEKRIGQLIAWKSPLHPLLFDKSYAMQGIDEYLGRELLMVLGHFFNLQLQSYQTLSKEQTYSYLHRLSTVIRLHVNETWFRQIPHLHLLPIFDCQILEVHVAHIMMGIDLREGIQNNQRLSRDFKNAKINALTMLGNALVNGVEHLGLNMKRYEVKWMRLISMKLWYYLQLREAKQLIVGQLREEMMQINSKNFLTISETFQDIKYDKMAAYQKLNIFLEFLIKSQSYNGLSSSIQELKEMKSKVGIEQTEQRLSTMGKLHMGNQQIWEIDKTIHMLRTTSSEEEGPERLELLLKNKQIPLRSTPEEQAKYRKELQEFQAIAKFIFLAEKNILTSPAKYIL